MNCVYIAIGSNLGDAQQNVIEAITALNNLTQTQVSACSSLYKSRPMGPAQPHYINAVVAIETALSPLDLLSQTQQIEHQFGRERKAERWGPRTLDLDILLYGELQLDTEKLTIPHYGMKLREFVLYPLNEIAPNLCLPDGCSLKKLLTKIDKNGLTLVDKSCFLQRKYPFT